MDVRLACAGRASDGELFERTAEAAHRVALEVGKNEHGIIIFDILADQILLDVLAVRDGELKIGTLGIENVDIEELAPAVFDHRAAVGVGRVALAGTHGLVELHDLFRRDLLGKINLCFHILILLRWIVYCLGHI